MNIKEHYEKNLYQHRCFSFEDRYQRIVDIVSSLKTFIKSPPIRVLDVGGGVGWLASEIQKLGNYDVFVNDISEKQLKEAKKRYKIKTILGDITEGLPISRESFDIVIFSEVIEHLFFPDKALKEIYRILRKDGFLIITTPNISTLQTRLQFLISGNLPELDPKGNHIRFFTKKTLENMLKENGFVVIKKYGSGWFRISPRFHRKDHEYENEKGELVYKWNWWLKILYVIKYKIISKFLCLNQDMVFVCKKS